MEQHLQIRRIQIKGGTPVVDHSAIFCPNDGSIYRGRKCMGFAIKPHIIAGEVKEGIFCMNTFVGFFDGFTHDFSTEPSHPEMHRLVKRGQGMIYNIINARDNEAKFIAEGKARIYIEDECEYDSI